MLNADFLLDDFHRYGSREVEFENLLQEIDKHTRYKVVSMKSLIIFSLLDPLYQDKAPETQYARVLLPGNPWVKDGKSRPPVYGFASTYVLPNVRNTDEYDKKLYAEMVQSNSMMVSIREEGRDNLYHLSTLALPTLAQRLGITSAAINSRSFAADALVAQLLNQSLEVRLVIKFYRRVGKICAVMSPRYADAPLHDVCVIYRELFGTNPKISKVTKDTTSLMDNVNLICEGWDITHEHVKIAFSFPGYAKDINEMYQMKNYLTPCLALSTSDIGESSFVAVGYWKTPGGAKIYDAYYRREHRGSRPVNKLDQKQKHEALREEIQRGVKENIFDKYTILPERLLVLLQIDITPGDADLSTARGRMRNRFIVTEAYKYAFKQLKMVSILSLKRLNTVMKQIDYGIIDETMRYTAYDVVTSIFEMERTMTPLLEHEGLCEETIRKFGTATSKAAYLDWEKFTVKEKKKEKEVEAIVLPSEAEG